jgi:hypothetical protein
MLASAVYSYLTIYRRTASYTDVQSATESTAPEMVPTCYI